MTIISTTHISSNEHGRVEIRIERTLRLVEWIKAVFKERSFKIKNTTTDVFVMIGKGFDWKGRLEEIWVHKDTGKNVDIHENLIIFEVQLHVALTDLAETRRYELSR